MTTKPLFTTGTVYMTFGAKHELEQAGVAASDLLDRHVTGDWGDLDPHDTRANNRALKDGDRIISNYPIGDDVRIWIITEWDRSATTILLPSEY